MADEPAQAPATPPRPQAGGLRRWWPLIVLAVVGAVLFGLATTDHPSIWPVRNILAYQLENWWADQVGAPQPAGTGALAGCIRDTAGTPLPTALVLLAEPDGTTHTASVGADGCYLLADLPAGPYVPMVGAPGYADRAVRRAWGWTVEIQPGQRHPLDVALEPATPPTVTPGRELRIGAPVTLTQELPQPGVAVRRELTYSSGGQPNQPTFHYLPVTDTAALPTLLTVYPTPALEWETASVALASAGYSLLAIGPTYTFDLEADIAELQRLVAFARAGRLPRTDGEAIALLGGSYSSLHVWRLLMRDSAFQGVVLLGPPTDLFDLRRRFEAGSFFPPFGLDQALIALGRPNTAPERYWRYSARYNMHPDLPPLLLMHSRADEIVPFQQSELLAAALERSGADYDAYFFDGMEHYLLADEASPQLNQLYERALVFLARVL